MDSVQRFGPLKFVLLFSCPHHYPILYYICWCCPSVKTSRQMCGHSFAASLWRLNVWVWKWLMWALGVKETCSAKTERHLIIFLGIRWGWGKGSAVGGRSLAAVDLSSTKCTTMSYCILWICFVAVLATTSTRPEWPMHCPEITHGPSSGLVAHSQSCGICLSYRHNDN